MKVIKIYNTCYIIYIEFLHISDYRYNISITIYSGINVKNDFICYLTGSIIPLINNNNCGNYILCNYKHNIIYIKFLFKESKKHAYKIIKLILSLFNLKNNEILNNRYIITELKKYYNQYL